MTVGTVVAFALAVVVPTVRAGVPPPGWSFTGVALALLTLVALHAYLGFTIYQMFRVALSERGVSLPTWRGRRLVPWSDVRRVHVQGHKVLLDAPGGRVVVNLVCFASPKAVLTYLARQMAPHVAPGLGTMRPPHDG